MCSIARQRNEGLDLSRQTAVCVGATQGIGAAAAIRFARAGANVVVVGRNEKLGQSVVKQCEAVRPAHARDAEATFIKADLSLVSGQKQAAKDIAAAAPNGIDMLVQTQGGPPNGKWTLTSEGHEASFAVQPLSRFSIPYLLLKSGALKSNGSLVNIAAPGGSSKTFDVDDVELVQYNKSLQGAWFAPLRRIMACGERDSVVLDAFHEELVTRYPKLRTAHCFPGVIVTNAAANRGFPTPLPQLLSIFGPIIGNRPETFADVPVLLATEGHESGRFCNWRLKSVTPTPWAQDPANRAALWDKLAAMVDKN